MNQGIYIDSVFLSFGDQKILRGIYLELEFQQITGILGSNGSGKSCLLKIITGQLKPQSKHLKFNGKRLDHLYKEKGLINYLPQHECHPKSARLHQLIRYYGIDLDAFVYHYPAMQRQLKTRFSDLSGGDRRIVEVLICIEAPSKLTILDEPFTHIMPLQVEVVKKAIKRVKSRKGIVITDHQYRHVLEISDCLYLLKEGRLEQISDEKDLKQKGYI